MSWAEHHSDSERLASAAQAALKAGNPAQADEYYLAAAKAERAAFDSLELTKNRTRGITAVSTVSLLYKGRDHVGAQAFACHCLGNEALPSFAVSELQDLLRSVWAEQAIAATGLRFARQDFFVRVGGGEVLTGGAPLDLIQRKVEEIRAIFYRTVEFLMNKPLRLRGGPTRETQELFRPWLFQAPPGSYQFAVRFESPKQMEFNVTQQTVPPVEDVTRKFIRILNSAATDPETALRTEVPDAGYRSAFLRLTRNLAPTGKSFEALEVRSDFNLTLGPTILTAESRRAINDLIKKHQPTVPGQDEGEHVKIEGILRAVHLDQDWLEVSIGEGAEQHIRIEKAGEGIDDVVGPLVNRPVIVEAIRTNGKHIFRDIQATE